MPPLDHAEPGAARLHPSRTLGILCVSALSYSLAQTVILPALPEVQATTGVSEATSTWLLTAFLLVSAVATPLLGRLGDMYGKERVLLYALLVFGLGSMLCAVGSHSIALLITGRAVQGAGGAIFPLAFGIIRDELPRERVSTSIGILSSTFGVGGGLGLVLAGVLIDHLSLAWLFWLCVVVTAVAAWATWRYIPESPVRAPARIDWGGGLLLSAGLAAILLGVSQGPEWGWASAGVIGLILAGMLVLAGFVAYERRVPEPLLDMAMMARRAIWSPNVAGFAVGFAMFSSFILIPQLVEAPKSTGYGFDLSATGAGLVLLPSSLVMLAAGPVAGWMGNRFGSRLPLVVGSVFLIAAFGMLAALHGEIWTIALGGALLGVGIALAFAAMANLVVAAVDPTQTGVATGINTIMRSIGGAVGGQIVASMLASNVLANGLPDGSGYTHAFLLSGVGAIVALAACALIPAPPRRGAPVPARAAA
jgi:EmrB/QacA subfamily drug resistance transporter